MQRHIAGSCSVCCLSGPQPFLSESVFQPFSSQGVLVPGLNPQEAGLILPHWPFFCVQLSGLSRPLWRAAQSYGVINHSSWFCVICKFAEGAFHPLSRPLMEVLNSIGLSTEPWSIPLVTNPQVDFVLLIATPLHPFLQPVFNPTLVSTYLTCTLPVCLKSK